MSSSNFLLTGLISFLLFGPALVRVSARLPAVPSEEKPLTWPDGARNLSLAGADDWEPRWSPDGGSIAFLTYRYGQPDLLLHDLKSDTFSPLLVSEFDPDGFRWLTGSSSLLCARPLLTGGRLKSTAGLVRIDVEEKGRLDFNSGGFKWSGWSVSDDGNTAAASGFVATPDPYFFLRVYDALTGEFTDVKLDFPIGIREIIEIALSADASRCAIIAEPVPRRPDVFVADIESGQVRRLTEDGEDKHGMIWSPRDSMIAYLKIQDWTQVQQNEKEEREQQSEETVTRKADVQKELKEELAKFQKKMSAARTAEQKKKLVEDWNRTRERIMGKTPSNSSRNRTGRPNRRDRVFALFVIDPDRGGARFVLGEEMSIGTPSWHPDGRRIFCSAGWENQWNLQSVDTVSGKMTSLTDGWWRDFSPHCSPDGTRIVFVSNRSGDLDIFTLPLKGGRK